MAGIMLLVAIVILLAIGVPVGISFLLGIVTVMYFFPVTNIQFVAQNLYSALDSMPLIAIPCFIIAGAIMETGGLSKRLINVANSLVGFLTGGLAVVSVVACYFFGAISGSAPATTAAIGGIMIPAMFKQGYDKAYSTGVVAIAGGLGVIVPPSIPFIIYGCTVNVSVGDLFLAGFIPAAVVALFLIAAVYYTSAKEGYKGTGEKLSLKAIGKAVWEGLWALLMPVIILGGIYGGIFTPTEAAVVAIVYGIIIGVFVYKELTFKKVLAIFDEQVSFIGAILLTFAPAAVLGLILNLLGIPQLITDGLMAISTNKYVILLLINILLIFVGMVMDTISAIVIFAPLFVIPLQHYGINPLHFGIIMTVNLALGFVTPPVAANLFVASSMTGIPMEQLVKKIPLLLIAMFTALFIITFIPQLSLFLPNLIKGM